MWMEYYKKLVTEKTEQIQDIEIMMNKLDIQESDISVDEIKISLRGMQNNNSPGIQVYPLS